MSGFQLSRRAALRGAGGILVGLPALEAMSARSARAAATPAPRRLVIFYTPNGTDSQITEPDFWPQQTGANFVLGKETSPLEPLRKNLLVVSGVNGESMKQDDSTVNPKAAGHGDLHSIGMSQMLTGLSYVYDATTGVIAGALPGGYAGGISIDQYLAKKLAPPTRFPTLEFGVINATDAGILPFSRMISAGRNQPIPAEQDPAKMFTRIFTSGAPMGQMTVDQSVAQRKSVLDFVLTESTRLEQRLSTGDRQKLDQHLTHVRDLETRLRPLSTPVITQASCNSVPAVQNAGDPLDKANFPATGKLHMDLLTLALKCDVTRIASLQWSWARSNLVHSWAGAAKGHHDMSHEGKSTPLTGVNTWYAQQLAYFGQALLATPDVDGKSLLDNTLVYWCSDVAWGINHSFDGLRSFFLGSCGGTMKTGQHIAVGGQTHQKLLVTLLNAMGVMENQFGDTQYGTGPLATLLA
jgi:Protein of unknown function (DUF1552)